MARSRIKTLEITDQLRLMTWIDAMEETPIYARSHAAYQWYLARLADYDYSDFD